MLTLERLAAHHLAPQPFWQRFFAAIIRLDHRRSGTRIVIEGLENLPTDRRVFIAMNHTDRFNSIPFQVEIARRGLGWTATWVKPKYYEHPVLAWFMRATNQIPLPSRGWLVATELSAVLGRVPTEVEYRAVRDVVDGVSEVLPDSLAAVAARRGGPAGLRAHLLSSFSALMNEVLRLNREALFERGLHVVVFPEGTRSRHLARGHSGLAQVSQRLGAAIVPVGCSGNDLLYPGNRPFSRGGTVTYRVGRPLEPGGEELGPHRVSEPFEPFTPAAEHRHGQAFGAITATVMDHIASLVDPRYGVEPLAAGDGREGDGREGDGREGSRRVGAERFM